jgi:plasmid maintenance system antidote protein VapI
MNVRCVMAGNVRIIFGFVKAPFSDHRQGLPAHTFPMPKKQTPMSEEVGDRLKQLRVAMAYPKLRHFAEMLGVPEDRYDKWEKGKALIPPDEARKLKTQFGITADWLYYGDEASLPHALWRELQAGGKVA